jgi:endonuclease/exonuclease/phosphatase family metal-dependent hydrolase
MPLRITTFNCENLFGRYRILDKPANGQIKNFETLLQIPEVVTLEPGRSGRIKPKAISEKQRVTTANAILGAMPDILAVQEVENLATLRIFNSKYMKNAFDRILLIDGNDARGIDVGFLIRKGVAATLQAVRTHVDDDKDGGFLEKSNRLDTKVTGQATFSRDCLEVEARVNGSVLTFLVNHFKAQDQNPNTTARRERQAARVADLAKAAHDEGKKPVVLGDFNIDTRQVNYDGSLDSLVDSPVLHDPFADLGTNDRWTHFFSSKKTVSRLDYILVDDSLQPKVLGVEIFRRGLSPKATQFPGPRLPSMQGNGLEASDHCPTTVVLNL